MPDYKIVDATQLDADMESLADSIRAKAEVTDKLAFPAGMKAAVDEIRTGGDTSVEDSIIGRTLAGEYTNDRVTTIGDYGFSQCRQLTSVNLPNVTSCGKYSFQGCFILSSVNIPLLESAGTYMFSTCSNLRVANFPLLTSVPQAMFSSCGQLVTADFAVATSIGTNVFNMNKNLTQLILRSPTIVTLNGNINGAKPIVDGTGYIYVPSALIDEYKTATNWSTYAEQFRALEDYTVDGTTTGELDSSKI